MPKALDLLSQQQLESIMQELTTATEGVTTALQLMKQADLQKAYFEWSESHWGAYDKIIGLGQSAVQMVRKQVAAKRENRPSEFELIKNRSRRDATVRKSRQPPSATASPPKTRGRPRKSQ